MLTLIGLSSLLSSRLCPGAIWRSSITGVLISYGHLNQGIGRDRTIGCSWNNSLNETSEIPYWTDKLVDENFPFCSEATGAVIPVYLYSLIIAKGHS